jgi:hypothetical protein
MNGSGIGKGPGGTYAYKHPTSKYPPSKYRGPVKPENVQPGFIASRLADAFVDAMNRATSKEEAAEIIADMLASHGIKMHIPRTHRGQPRKIAP